jgi:outer membrane protein assembly factor BamB
MGSNSLRVVWKTPIPGEGCSSPVVSQGRVYVTTAYAGSQPHAWDAFAGSASVLLALCVAGLALSKSRARLAPGRASLRDLALGVWTTAVVALTCIVLARPRWFWQFANPWTGTTVAAAELSWVESFHLMPMIVLACCSLALIFTWLSGRDRRETPEGSDEARAVTDEGRSRPSPRSRWLGLVTLAVTIACSILLGLMGGRPDWFFEPSQPWLAWLVTGGLGLVACAASIGWLDVGRLTRLLLAAVGLALAGWLFANTPPDEFGDLLNLQNRVTYLVPALLLLVAQAWSPTVLSKARRPVSGHRVNRQFAPPAWCVGLLLISLGGATFVRAIYLHPQAGLVRAVICLDAASGDVLWNTPVFVAPAEKRHSLNSLATPTPACAGERVFAYFGSGLAALDTQGRVLWLKRDSAFADFIRYGAGSSVVLAGERVIIFRDSEFAGHGDHLDDDIQSQEGRRPSVLIAYDARTGTEAWNVTPPFSHDSYMTPLVWTRDHQTEVVIATWKTVAGFALSDGSLRWTHAYPMQQIVPSPAVNGDCLFITGGHVVPCPLVAVRTPSSGATEAQTTWWNRIAGGTIVSPVCWDGHLFSVSHLGVLTCRDAESGQVHWTTRLGSRCLASLVAGDGKVYALDQDGILQVFAAGSTGTLLATPSLDEPCTATPALVPGMLIVRTSGHVCCLGNDD